MTIEETRTGRPRDPGRDTAILKATRELLGQVGYDEVTVRAIAQRAGAGLATIYRRWPTKEELVADAVASYQPPSEPEPGVDPIEAMVSMLTGLVEQLQGPERGMIPTIIGQVGRNTALAEALRERVILPRLTIATKQLGTLPGVDPERVEAAAVMLPGSIILHVLLLGRQMSTADVRKLVEMAVQAAR